MKILSNKKKEKIAVYIDGSNFYKYLKNKEINFPKGIKFDFNKFIDFLVGERKLISKRYYVGFSHAPSLGMQKHADFSVLLRPDDVNKFKKDKLI